MPDPSPKITFRHTANPHNPFQQQTILKTTNPELYEQIADEYYTTNISAKELRKKYPRGISKIIASNVISMR